MSAIWDRDWAWVVIFDHAYIAIARLYKIFIYVDQRIGIDVN